MYAEIKHLVNCNLCEFSHCTDILASKNLKLKSYHTPSPSMLQSIILYKQLTQGTLNRLRGIKIMLPRADRHAPPLYHVTGPPDWGPSCYREKSCSWISNNISCLQDLSLLGAPSANIRGSRKHLFKKSLLHLHSPLLSCPRIRRESIPRQVHRKSEVPKEERGVWGSQGGDSSVQFSSVNFSHSVTCDSLQPHEPQHARPPCTSPISEFTQTHVH